MLFANKTEDLVQQSLKLAKDIINNDRKREVEEALDFLDGEQGTYIEPNPDESSSHFMSRPKLTFSLADLILSDLSLLYKQPPARFFDGEDSPAEKKAREWMDAAEDDGQPIDLLLYENDRRVRWLGNQIVRVLPDDSDNPRYPRLSFFAPDQVDVLQDPDNPARAASIILCISRADTAAATDSHFQIWTKDERVEVVKGRIEEREAHPFGRIPLVVWANSIETQRFWSPGLATKLLPAMRAFDRLWSSLILLCLKQAHATAVAKNANPQWIDAVKNGRAGWGMEQLVQVGEDGEFMFASPGAQITQFLEVLGRIAENIYRTAGLPLGNWQQTSQPESGYAYMVKNASILEDREWRASMFKPRERALWRLMFDVGRAWIDSRIPEPKEISIDYAEPEFPIPQAERTEELNWKLEQNLLSVVDLIMAEDSDLTAEEAEARLMENKRINAAFKKGGQPPQEGNRIGGLLEGLGLGGGAPEEEEE